MPQKTAIPTELESAVFQRHQQGETGPQIVAWLAGEHRIHCSRKAVDRCLARLASRDPGARSVTFADQEEADAAADLPPATPLETVQHWKREAHREARVARDGRGEDWKRYHSAMGLVLRAAQIEQAILVGPKRPAATTPEPGVPAPLTQEERDRIVEGLH